MTPRDIQDYALGALNFGGLFASREKDGAMTEDGVSVAAIRVTIVGFDEDENATRIVAHLTRDQVAEMALALTEMVCDG